MTLSQNVEDALKLMDGCISTLPKGNKRDWQTIRAHLLSQAAEIERLRANNDKLYREHVALQNATVAAESRLAAANERLETTERTLERCKQILDTTSECWRLDAERLEAAERDAARYRWLRTRIAGREQVAEMVEYNDMGGRLPLEVDAAIDAATQEIEG
jgi:outer membrane murein-binding lipoprotein Lpp